MEVNENQTDSIDYSNEESVNAAAAKELEAKTIPTESKTVEQSGKAVEQKTDVASAEKQVQKTDPQKPEVKAQPAFDAEKSFADVQKQLSETRKWATQMAQERAQLRKELEAIQKAQKPVLDKVTQDNEQQDLQHLLSAMQAQDPRALHAFLQKREEALKAQMSEANKAAVEEAKAEARAAREEAKSLKYDREVEKRKADSTNFPNFAELEQTMVKLVQSGTVTWDEQQPISNVIDHLYNLAKTQHSEEAIKQAEVHGRKKAEAELANEAKAAVATGGKGVSTTPADLHTMPLDKLEALAIQLHGVADRD